MNTPNPRKGRIVLKPSDVDQKELEELRRQIQELRVAHNDLVWTLNRQTRWIEQFNNGMRRTFDYAVWRFCAWILPLPLPPYEHREEIPYLQLRDAKPMFGAHDEA